MDSENHQHIVDADGQKKVKIPYQNLHPNNLQDINRISNHPAENARLWQV
jgi:hypothetical protein